MTVTTDENGNLLTEEDEEEFIKHIIEKYELNETVNDTSVKTIEIKPYLAYLE